jgi:hypothetical protein
MIIEEKPDSLKALEELIKATLLRSAGHIDKLIIPKDLEHVYDLLLIVAKSDSYLRWGRGREFV